MNLQVRMMESDMERLKSEAVRLHVSVSWLARELIVQGMNRPPLPVAQWGWMAPTGEAERTETEMVARIQAAQQPMPVDRSDKKVEKVEQPLSVSERMRRMREGD